MTKLVRSIKRRCAPKLTTPVLSNRDGQNPQNMLMNLNSPNKFKSTPFRKMRGSFKKKQLSPSNKFKRTPLKSQNLFHSPKLDAQQKLLNGLNNGRKCLNDDIITCLDDDDDTDDDDCVVIEPTMVKIVIDDDDDDVPTTSQASMTNNTPMKNDHKLNVAQLKAEDRSLFFECYKTNALILNDKPIYSTELPKLGTNRSGTKKYMKSCDTHKRSHRKENPLDESVIFVSETNTCNDFVPLVSNDVPNPMTIQQEPPRQTSNKTPPINKLRHSLFTAKEQKDLTAINCNAYNPAAAEGNSNTLTKNKKRTVLIDGSNVAFGHSLMKDFSVEGLKICIDYFDKIGHDVKAVVPMFRRNMNKSTNPQLLDELQQLGKVIFTPCKNLPGLVSSSYDDRFIVQLACELDAAIISNDNYRDIIHESTAFKKLIENRVIGYVWCDNIFMLPKDPYGRFGPTLEEILYRQ